MDLPSWPPFWAHLKNLEAFLVHRWRVQRYLATCLPEGVLPPPGLEHVHTRLYEQRWGCVADFLAQVNPLLDFLRSTWSADKFVHGADSHQPPRGNDKAFDPQMLSEALHSTGFHLKVHMMLHVEQNLQGLARWAEGCDCHTKLFENRSRKQRESFMEASLAAPGTFLQQRACPFASRRAPQLAAGQLQEYFAELSKQGESQIFSCTAAIAASAEEKSEVATMFRHCTGRVFLLVHLCFLGGCDCDAHPGPNKTHGIFSRLAL